MFRMYHKQEEEKMKKLCEDNDYDIYRAMEKRRERLDQFMLNSALVILGGFLALDLVALVKMLIQCF